MAIIYKVKDGPSGDRTDEGKEIPVSVLTDKLTYHTCKYLAEIPPEFEVGNPSDYYRHVVIEVSDERELNKKFPKKGFYIVTELDVKNAAFLY